jgi:hypothetical protein
MNTSISNKKDDTSNSLLIGNLIVVLALQFVMIFIKEGWNYSYQDFLGLLALLLLEAPKLLAESIGHLIAIVIMATIAVGLFKLLHRLHKKPYDRPRYHFSITCWIMFLLSSHSQAMATGVFSMVFWFFAAVMGVIIFSIAHNKKMTGWIVVSSFCTFWLALGVVGFVFGFVHKENSILPQATNLQTVQGLNKVYSIQIPAEWKIERKTDDDYDIFAHHRSLYVGVITEEADFGSSQTAAEQIQTGFREETTDLKFSDKTSFMLDGRNWVQFTVHCRFKNLPIAYLIYVYSGSEGMFEVIGWTSQNLFDRDIKVMHEIMQTFHFAKKPDSLVNTAVAPVKLTLKEAIVQFDIARNHYYNKKYAEANKLWLLAADANILEAYNNLGYLNYYGLGVTQNQEEGLRLWRIAATNGFSESQIHLSEAYSEGISLQKDLIEAYAWAKAAAYFAPQVGDDDLQKTFEHDSKKLIQQYSTKLSKAELKQAENRAQSLISTISETLKSTPYIRRFPKLEPTLPVPATEYGVKNS